MKRNFGLHFTQLGEICRLIERVFEIFKPKCAGDRLAVILHSEEVERY